eukprot:TRINITY_DN9068_c0_g1_i3.p1 TRINITY_DN9068_c0_g1~~TRINITY_DN9068_c0_g1_i3.p1  ORF type:complete len:436 (-),score=64.80 TRINITY_DN9068_c0_g1_i3:229-1536(-)
MQGPSERDEAGLQSVLPSISMASRDVIKKLLYENKFDEARSLITEKHGLTDSRGGESPLHICAALGDAEMFRFLMTPPCNPFEVIECTESGVTAFHIACRKGFVDVVTTGFALKPAQVLDSFVCGLKDDDGWTLLLCASLACSVQLLRFLLERADANAVQAVAKQNQFTALHFVAVKDNADAIELLVQHNASVDARDRSQRTPLCTAVQENCLNSVRALLKAGADPAAVDAEGMSCIQWAEALELHDMLSLLSGQQTPGTANAIESAVATAASESTVGDGSRCSMCQHMNASMCLDCVAPYCTGCFAMFHRAGTLHRHRHDVSINGSSAAVLCGWCHHVPATVTCSRCELSLCNDCSEFLHHRTVLASHGHDVAAIQEASTKPLSRATAHEYLRQHGVSDKFERVFTDMLIDRPPAPLLYISDRLHQMIRRDAST